MTGLVPDHRVVLRVVDAATTERDGVGARAVEGVVVGDGVDDQVLLLGIDVVEAEPGQVAVQGVLGPVGLDLLEPSLPAKRAQDAVTEPVTQDRSVAR